MNDSKQIIVEQLLKANKILIITHRRPDPDALGSMTAVWKWLSDGKKQIDLYSIEPASVDNYFSVFGLSNTMLTKNVADIVNTVYDCVVILDCGSLYQAGIEDWFEDYKKQNPQTAFVNIDHHASNNYFGTLNYVVSEASSTCQLVFELMRSQQQSINSFIATALLYGIVADTGSFSNGATNLESLKISSELLQLGARHNQVSRAFLCNKETSLLKLWGIALSRLQLILEYRIAYTYITKDEMKNFGAIGSEGLSNFLNDLNDADVVMVLTEKDDGTIKGSLRTTKDNVNVMQIAAIFGGGGHVKAAGFTVEGDINSLTEIISKVTNSMDLLKLNFDKTNI